MAVISVSASENDRAANNVVLVVDGRQFPVKDGKATIALPDGVRQVEVQRDTVPVFTMPVIFDSELPLNLDLVLDKPGAIEYQLTDASKATVFDSGVKIAAGQEASVGGVVKAISAETGEEVPAVNALVQLVGADKYTVTDAQGQFSFKDLPAGDYTLAVQSPDYLPMEPVQFYLAPAESAERALTLELASETLAEIVVTEKGVSQRAVDGMEERDAAGVAEVVGQEQLTRGGDSDVGGALKRVSGMSLVGGKFVYVRGLGERYSSVLLNGAQLPSPDPSRRVVPLDVFPNEIIDSVVVAKSYSAELPGEFAGGAVQLRTQSLGKDNYLKLRAGLNFPEDAAFTSALRSNGDRRDWLGRDQFRELPGSLASITRAGQPLAISGPNAVSAAQLEQAGEDLAAIGFDTNARSLGPSGNWAATYADRGEWFGKAMFFTAAARYAHEWDSVEETRNRYATSDRDPLFVVSEQARTRTEREVNTTGFLNAGVELASGHNAQFTAIALRQGIDQTQLDQGYDDSPDALSRVTELEWNENVLRTAQLSGDSYFENLRELTLDWQLSSARAERESPARRRYRYEQSGNDYVFSRATDGNEIVYEDLDDASENFRVSASLPFYPNDNWQITSFAGINALEKERASDIRRFRFTVVGNRVLDPQLLRRSPDQIFTAANIGSDGFALREVTRSQDNYSAEQSLYAAHFGADLRYLETWRVRLGVRAERNDQEVSTFDLSNPTDRVLGELKGTDWLPSIAATWLYADSQQLKLSYARTLSRPDFRELSPAPFFDPILDIESSGNPELEQTTIDHLDVRWEQFGDNDQSLSASLFWKRFKNPVERVVVPGTGGLLGYQNALEADVYGVEVEGFQQLDAWLKRDWASAWALGGNVSALKSSVDLGANVGLQTNRSRALQGQSNYLVNLQLLFSPPALPGLDSALSYNVAGRRIAQVGINGLPDIFEQPLHQLDLTANYSLSEEWKLGLRIKNLLNDEVLFSQGGEDWRRFRPGREFGFNIQWLPTLSNSKR